ncbi:integrase [compost metagenome]
MGVKAGVIATIESLQLMALAHVVANGAEAAYWRSDLLEKRHALMSDWADFVNLGMAGTSA